MQFDQKELGFDQKIEKMKSWWLHNIVLVSDFDGTLTLSQNKEWWSNSLMSIFLKTWLLGDNYKQKAELLYSKFHKFEFMRGTNAKINLKKWLLKHVKLLNESGMGKKMMNTLVFWSSITERIWLKGLLEFTWRNNIPVYIVTWWLSALVEIFLLEKMITTKNISIIWNRLRLKNNWVWLTDAIFTSINKSEQKPIHTLNKRIKSKNIILLWDNIEDSKIISNSHNGVSIKIWFHDWRRNLEEMKKEFDIIFSEHESLEKIFDLFTLITEDNKRPI